MKNLMAAAALAYGLFAMGTITAVAYAVGDIHAMKLMMLSVAAAYVVQVCAALNDGKAGQYFTIVFLVAWAFAVLLAFIAILMVLTHA